MIDRLRELLARFAAPFRRRKLDDDFQAELDAHLEMAVEEKVRQGLSTKEARRQALLDLGGWEQTRVLHRDTRGLPALDILAGDFLYALRTLRRDWALTGFAILILGVGIGGSSIVFSVFSALLLRPLPFAEPERLVWIANGESSNLSAQSVQVSNLEDFRQRSRTLEAVAGYMPFYGLGDVRLGGERPERVTAVPVSEGFFPLLGVEPFLGRQFNPEECLWNAPKAVLLSCRLWQRRFPAVT